MALGLNNAMEAGFSQGGALITAGYSGERGQDVARALHAIFPEIYKENVLGISSSLDFSSIATTAGDLGRVSVGNAQQSTDIQSGR